MANTEPMTVKFDVDDTIKSVVNGPHGNAVIFGCTICALALIAGHCYLTAEGHQFGDNHVQVRDDIEESM